MSQSGGSGAAGHKCDWFLLVYLISVSYLYDLGFGIVVTMPYNHGLDL